jgi:VanZ family protein
VFDRRFFLKYWLPVLAWMAVIYCGSTDLLSSARTTRFLVPLLRWLYPSISAEALNWAHVIIRKTGHVTEYAVLALLFWRTLYHLRSPDRPIRPGRRVWQAWLLATGYAITDEIHQSFYSSRYGSAWDVLIDSLGAAAGLLFLWSIGRWRNWW